MKKTPVSKPRKIRGMASEYRFDYKKAKPNRFAEKMKHEPVVVLLDDGVAQVFKTTEQVNRALRALISAMPEKKILLEGATFYVHINLASASSNNGPAVSAFGV
jgi:hypothetical protein